MYARSIHIPARLFELWRRIVVCAAYISHATHPLWFVCVYIHCAVCTRRERKGVLALIERRHRNFASSGVVWQRCQNFPARAFFSFGSVSSRCRWPALYLARLHRHSSRSSNSAYKHLPGGLPQPAQWLQPGDNHVGSPWSNWLKGERACAFNLVVSLPLDLWALQVIFMLIDHFLKCGL